MPEQPPTSPQVVAQVQASLHELARVLREAHHLEPQAQEALADLVEELSKALDPATSPSPETAHLAESAAQLAQALQQRHNRSLLAAARDRLAKAALRVESEAPMTTAIVGRLLDTLADLGI